MAKKTKATESDGVIEEQTPVSATEDLKPSDAESVPGPHEAASPPSPGIDDQIGAPLEGNDQGEEENATDFDMAGFMERMEQRFVESAAARNATLEKMNMSVVAATVNISLAEVREFRRNDKSLQQMTDLSAWAALRIALAKEIMRQSKA